MRDPLRRTHEPVIRRYKIGATDGSLGELEDLLFDEADWTLRFIVVDTRKWLPGRHVVVPVDRVDHVSWGESAVSVRLTKMRCATAPNSMPA